MSLVDKVIATIMRAAEAQALADAATLENVRDRRLRSACSWLEFATRTRHMIEAEQMRSATLLSLEPDLCPPLNRTKETIMSDDKTRQGRDRAQVAGGEEYEVCYFAEKHGMTVEETQELIDRVGNSRDALDAAAQALRGNQP